MNQPKPTTYQDVVNDIERATTYTVYDCVRYTVDGTAPDLVVGSSPVKEMTEAFAKNANDASDKMNGKWRFQVMERLMVDRRRGERRNTPEPIEPT